MDKVKQNVNIKHWQGCREAGSLIYCWCECEVLQPLWKNSLAVLENTKHATISYNICNPAIELLGIVKRNENLGPHKSLYSFIYSNFICNSPKLKQSSGSE